MRLSFLVICLACVSFCGATADPTSPRKDQGSVATERFIIEALPDRLSRRVESQRKMLLQFGLGDPAKTSKGVINALKVWTVDYPKLRVCFFAGPQQVRSRVAKIAMEWNSTVPGLPILDFGDPANPRLCKKTEVNHIRIGFHHPEGGYWSLVGQDSIRQAGQDEQSLNLEDFDKTPPSDDEYHATVLHEFGHAIGLEHEHQNPMSKCHDEFDWPKLYKYLGGPPNNWSKETVDFNMGALNEPGLLSTDFDNRSIMLYTFPAWFYKNGTAAHCYSEQNKILSDGDQALVAQLYPANQNDRIALAKNTREHHLAMIKASAQAEGSKSGVFQLIDEYLPEHK